MSTPLLGFPEEVLHQVVLSLVDDADYEYQEYPRLLYHYVSSEISALSLVNRQFRRICFSFLFSYVQCASLAELENLERKLLANSAFTSFIRILNVEGLGQEQASNALVVQETLLRPLPRLESLVWLDLGETELTPALVTAIQKHPTLETAAIEYLQFYTSLPKSPVNLGKILLHCAKFPDVGEISIVQHRNIRVLRWDLDISLIPPMETRIQDLRHVSVIDYAIGDEQLNQFHAFVAHHTSLTKISVYTSLSDCNVVRPHLSSFLEVVEAHSFDNTIELIHLVLSPKKSTSKKGLAGWEVTELTLNLVTSSLLESLCMIGSMFPQLVSLSITLIFNSAIHVDSLVSLTSKHFPTLQVLKLDIRSESLIWIPLLLPTLQRQHSDEQLNHVASRMCLLAWQIFQRSSSMVSIELSQEANAVTPQWSVVATYQAKRNFFGAMLGMKTWSRAWYIPTEIERLEKPFRGFVVL